jgi:hypothetical protein
MLFIDLDPPHEGADDVAPHSPICPVQPILGHRAEPLQLARDELERASLLGGILECRGLSLELADALPRPAYTSTTT